METIRLNLVPVGATPICHTAQYDEGRQIKLELYNGAAAYQIQAGDTFEINIRKPDNHVVETSITGTQGNTYLILETTEQMCAVPGINICKIKVKNSGDEIGTLIFNMMVQMDVLADGDPSQSVIEDLDAMIAAAIGNDYYDKTATDNLLALKADKTELAALQGEIEKCFIPSTNINDEVYEYGGMWNGSPFASDTYARTKNFLPIEGGATLKAYAYYGTIDTKIASLLIAEFDSSKQFIKQSSLYAAPRWVGYDITLDANTAYIKFSLGDEIVGLDLSLLKISIYRSTEYVAEYTPYLTGAWNEQELPERGIKKSSGAYIHFTKCGTNLYICREYKRVYVNNLLQLYKMYYGTFSHNDIIKGSDIGTSWSDRVGPISVHRGSIDNYSGKWTGGSHGVTINGTEYATAEQASLKVYVDDTEVSSDGIYFGDVTIIAVNNLYFPQTITGADLSGATLAFTEKRIYRLTDLENVKVFLTAGAQGGGCPSYYGCQINTYNMTNIWLPNCEKELSLNPPEADVYYFENKETKLYCFNSTKEHFDVDLKNVGLGTFAHNTGTSDMKWGNVARFQKVYFQLIKDTSFSAGAKFMWEADYNFYLD